MSNARMWTLATIAAGTSAALLIGGAGAALAHDRGDRHPSISHSATPGATRGPLAGLVADGTLTATQAAAVHTALHAQREAEHADHEAEMTKARDAVLATLVANGTLTQAKADAIRGADRGGMRELLADGTVTRSDLQAVHDALKANRDETRAEHEAQRKAQLSTVLSGLVTAGTLTQAQAGAVLTALDERPVRGAGHGGHRR